MSLPEPAPPAISTVELDVPSLGVTSGLCFDNTVCQYLGIPYATVPGRFRKSVLATAPWAGGRRDGAKLGCVTLFASSSS